MRFLSALRRFARRLFPVNEFHLRGYPTPIGQGAVSVIVSRDDEEFAFLVGNGQTGMKPVAIVFAGDDSNQVTRADYRKARAIAMDLNLAGSGDRHIVDLRQITPAHILWQDLMSHALFPTDSKGRRVWHAGETPVCGSRFTATGSIRIALHPEALWENIPTFDFPGLAGEGWAPVPKGLKDHLEKIDPRPIKNGDQCAVAILPPGQLKSNEISELTAARTVARC